MLLQVVTSDIYILCTFKLEIFIHCSIDLSGCRYQCDSCYFDETFEELNNMIATDSEIGFYGESDQHAPSLKSSHDNLSGDASNKFINGGSTATFMSNFRVTVENGQTVEFDSTVHLSVPALKEVRKKNYLTDITN